MVCVDTEEIRRFLEDAHDGDYDYLLECDDEDLEFCGKDCLERINVFRKLLGAKEELTIEDVQHDRRA